MSMEAVPERAREYISASDRNALSPEDWSSGLAWLVDHDVRLFVVTDEAHSRWTTDRVEPPAGDILYDSEADSSLAKLQPSAPGASLNVLVFTNDHVDPSNTHLSSGTLAAASTSSSDAPAVILQPAAAASGGQVSLPAASATAGDLPASTVEQGAFTRPDAQPAAVTGSSGPEVALSSPDALGAQSADVSIPLNGAPSSPGVLAASPGTSLSALSSVSPPHKHNELPVSASKASPEVTNESQHSLPSDDTPHANDHKAHARPISEDGFVPNNSLPKRFKLPGSASESDIVVGLLRACAAFHELRNEPRSSPKWARWLTRTLALFDTAVSNVQKTRSGAIYALKANPFIAVAQLIRSVHPAWSFSAELLGGRIMPEASHPLDATSVLERDTLWLPKVGQRPCKSYPSDQLFACFVTDAGGKCIHEEDAVQEPAGSTSAFSKKRKSAEASTSSRPKRAKTAGSSTSDATPGPVASDMWPLAFGRFLFNEPDEDDLLCMQALQAA